MNSWIEEAEKREILKNAKVNKENLNNLKIIEANNVLIQGFINRLCELIDRINKIPPSSRQPSNEVGYTKLEGEYKYEFYGSANILKKKKFLFLNLGKTNYIVWRRIFFELTDKENRVKLTIYEKYNSSFNSENLKKYKEKYLFNIKRLDEKVEDSIINWLVFRISNKEFTEFLPIHRRNGYNKDGI